MCKTWYQILAILGLIAMILFEFFGIVMTGAMSTVIISLVMTFVGGHVPIKK
jgi:uncharacterized membrane protein